jgi:hypothetical protein
MNDLVFVVVPHLLFCCLLFAALVVHRAGLRMDTRIHAVAAYL